MPRMQVMLFRLCLLMIALALCGCSATITPPASPVDPLTVAVVDYGRHSSVVLPNPDGAGSIEYAFGDWDWFAINKNTFIDGTQAMLWSKGSTLGRRRVDVPPDSPELSEALRASRVMRLRIARQRVMVLRETLDQPFRFRANQAVYNPVMDLHFIPDQERYGILNNCNHVTARWLRELGCEIRGNPVTSQFKIDAPSRSR